MARWPVKLNIDVSAKDLKGWAGKAWIINKDSKPHKVSQNTKVTNISAELVFFKTNPL